MLEKFKRIPKVFQHVYLLIIVYFGWILFRFTDMGTLGAALQSMFGLNGNGFSSMQEMCIRDRFEELFPYEETEDQSAAIEATKNDMESTKIMDRLICGDVGYGKTEIAIRAAFKDVYKRQL